MAEIGTQLSFRTVFQIEHPKFSEPKYQEYRMKWEQYPRNFIVGDFPIHLDIDVTTYCNLRCPMCPRTLLIASKFKLDNGHFPMYLYKSVINEGSTYGLCAVNLNYLGEPLLNSNIVNMVEYASKCGILDIMFHTNATLLTPEISRRLIDAGLIHLHLSIDAANPITYEMIRVGAKFDQVLKNVKEFMDIRRKKRARLPVVRAQMVLMKENAQEAEDFVRFWSDIVDSIGIREYRNPSLLDKVDRYSKSRILKKNNFICPDLWRRLVINVDGSVIPCCRDTTKDMVVGNIHKSTIREIWIGDRMKKLRQLHRMGKAIEIEGCSKCDYVRE